MTAIRRFGHFWWDFVVGDDWRVALGVVASLSATWVAAQHGLDWFWLVPIVVLSMLALSLRRATRPAPPRIQGDHGRSAGEPAP